MITVGSLFAGIGGIELGLERTGGFRTVWQVEIDDYARRVLEKHWPDVRRWGDVRTFPPEPVDEWGCDLICGGFPCQDISYAGKGAGLAGARSGLWYEFARVVGVVRPRFVLVENVAALLTRGLGDVLGTLASLGYDAEWHCIPAAAVGADHQRDRLFVLAYADKEHRRFCHDQAQGHRGCLWEDHNFWGKERHSWNGDYRGLRADSLRRADQLGIHPVADGFSHEMVSPLRAIGNAVVPQVAEWIGHQILAAETTP
jgi:DNA (cytosine-5)-methyltransferase 1